jgi:pilus assembly protein Flp/PilA
MLLGLYTRMHASWAALRARIQEERGAVATEYALLLVLIALAIIGAATYLGLRIAGVFNSAGTTLNNLGA